MCQLFETIKIVRGEPQDLEFHQRRFDSARKKKFVINKKYILDELIECPEDLLGEVLKCKLIYNKNIIRIDYEIYDKRDAKSFRLIFNDEIDYNFKYLDRSKINSLYETKGNCDDIIVVKNGLVSDASYANLVFLKDEKLFTPKTPLLKGTKRQKYIDSGLISEMEIRVEDLKMFSHLKRINAMLDLEENPWIPVENVLV